MFLTLEKVSGEHEGRPNLPFFVGMAELVDALGLGSSEVIRGGSSPLTDTIMEIIDNFLSEEDFQKLEETITRGTFEWRKSTILSSSRFRPNQIHNIQFVHRFASVYTESVDGVLEKYGITKSKHFDIIEPILDKIEYSKRQEKKFFFYML